VTAYHVSHRVDNGIEWISYLPTDRRFPTPLFFQHGMWHGAWCWEPWQALFAAWGWESHAISLPGHAGSPVQRPLRWCTLSYYLRFLTDALAALPSPPIVIGHSMGGALTQWYLKHHGDLPAAVLVAPWPAFSLLPSFWRVLKRDPLGGLLNQLTLSATPSIRTPARAAALLITEGARYTPAELHAHLGPESGIIMYQHNPPWWIPPRRTKTPLLWLAAADDAVIAEASQRRSAAHYQADYRVIARAGHNLMMEHNYHETASTIGTWLKRTVGA
jgi:pimeloyl-ACP methyl ester carboxylesterase